MLGKSLNDVVQIEGAQPPKELAMGLMVADSVPPSRRYSIYHSFND